MSEQAESLNALVGEVLRRREKDSRFRANVARGLNPLTERYAYPWVLPRVHAPHEKILFLRVAGIVASYPEIPNSGSYSLGATFRKLSRKRNGENVDDDKPDAVASRLMTLEDFDLEAAVETLRRLFDLNKQTQIPTNYFALAHTLSRWGNGQSDASLKVRRRIIGDYYGAWSSPVAATNAVSV